jgi:hypothetical protein
MKHITKLLFSIFVLILASCSTKKESASLISITFDDISGFLDPNNPIIINTAIAHSGNTCAMVDKEHIYGPTFRRNLSLLPIQKIKKVKIKGWVRKDSDSANLKIVCSVSNGEANMYWNAIDTKSKNLKKGEWQEIEFENDISKANAPEYTLSVYPMNDDNDKILIDDLTIEFE